MSPGPRAGIVPGVPFPLVLQASICPLNEKAEDMMFSAEAFIIYVSVQRTFDESGRLGWFLR